MAQYTEQDLQILEEPFVEIRKKVTILLRMGCLLSENGANANQIVRDMRRAAAYMGIPEDHLHIHIAYSNILINIHGESECITSFRKVQYMGANMEVISAISVLTWTALQKVYTLDEFAQELERIAKKEPPYSNLVSAIFAGFACGAFPILFGGTIISAWITTFCAFIGFIVLLILKRFQINGYISIASAAAVSSGLAFLSGCIFDSSDVIYAMIACTLFMVPGIPLINTVDDLLNNHILAGISRAVHTILIVGSMTVGISMAQYFNHSYDFTHLSIVPDSISPVLLGAAIVGAAGYAVMFYTPKHLLPLIGIGGLIAILVKNTLILHLGFSVFGATFIAAAMVSLFSLKAARHVKTSSKVLAIPSAIPLVPGVFIYRFLYAMLHINSLTSATLVEAIQSGVTAILIIISIGVGVAIPSILAGKILDARKEKKLESLLDKRYT